MSNLTLACLCLTLSGSVAAQVQPATRTTQTSAASANFAYMSDDGCIESQVTVFANRTTVNAEQAPATMAVMYSRHRYDYCENSDLGTDLGTSLRPVFSGDLNRAALNTTISGTTAAGSGVSVSFELVWEGRGDARRLLDEGKGASGRARLIRNESQTRGAVVSGTVDGQNVAGATLSATLRTSRKTVSR